MDDAVVYRRVYLQILAFNCYKHCENFALFPLLLTRQGKAVVFQDFCWTVSTLRQRLDLYRANLHRALGKNNGSSLANTERQYAQYYVRRINFVLSA